MAADRETGHGRDSSPRSSKRRPRSTLAILDTEFKKTHRVSGKSKTKQAGLDIALDQLYVKAMAMDPKAISAYLALAEMVSIKADVEPKVRVVVKSYQCYLDENGRYQKSE